MFMYNPMSTKFIINKPPTLYSILDAYCNYGKEEKTKVKDLALVGRELIFDFEYPLTSKINKVDFEKMILNNFLDRRIGLETVTAFKIKLDVKLNEIMPIYNKMFEMLDGWDIFSDGEETNRIINDSRNIENTNNGTTSTTTNATTTNSIVKDIRKSDTPENELEDVQNGSYVSNYEYNQNNGTSTDNSTNSGTSQNTQNTTNEGTLEERIIKSSKDKIKDYNDFITNRKHIYSMIFKDLECLFYQLV